MGWAAAAWELGLASPTAADAGKAVLWLEQDPDLFELFLGSEAHGRGHSAHIASLNLRNHPLDPRSRFWAGEGRSRFPARVRPRGRAVPPKAADPRSFCFLLEATSTKVAVNSCDESIWSSKEGSDVGHAPGVAGAEPGPRGAFLSREAARSSATPQAGPRQALPPG